MGKIDSWIPKIPRLKNAKVSRFSYRDAAYTNDDIEGFDNYDYTRDMNVPTLNKTDTESSVLDSGARAQFSSLSKNALNHFFGRVSYNLNKVIDFLSDFLDDFISFQATNTAEHNTINTNHTNLSDDFIEFQSTNTAEHNAINTNHTNLSDDFIELRTRYNTFSELTSVVTDVTLPTYDDGTKKRFYNSTSTRKIITFPIAETFNGSGSLIIEPYTLIEIVKNGTTWLSQTVFSTVLQITADVTLAVYQNSTTLQIYNNAAIITQVLFPSGETFYGASFLTLQPKSFITITKIGTSWVKNASESTNTPAITRLIGTDGYTAVINNTDITDSVTQVEKKSILLEHAIYVPSFGSTWKPFVQTLPVAASSKLHKQYIDDSIHIIVGDNGICAISYNSGATFASKSVGTSVNLYHVFRANNERLVILGAGGTIKTSDDNGYTWVTKTSGTANSLFNGVKKGTRLICIGAGGTCITSDNNGDSWTARSTGTTKSLVGLTVSGTRVIAVGDQTSLTSDNSGLSWTVLNVSDGGTRYYFTDVVVVDTDNLVASCNDGSYAFSINNGTSWVPVILYASGGPIFTSVLAYKNRVILVGSGGACLTNDDFGLATSITYWTVRFTSSDKYLRGLFEYKNKIYALSDTYAASSAFLKNAHVIVSDKQLLV